MCYDSTSILPALQVLSATVYCPLSFKFLHALHGLHG
jgi:hypothetical protein